MRSRTSIALYVGLLLFIAGLGFTCVSIVVTAFSLNDLHRFKTQYPDFDYEYDAYGYAYAQRNARLSAILAFYILLAVAFAVWLVCLTVFLCMLRVRRDDVARRARLVRAFCIVFCSIATALAAFGAIVFAVSATTAYGYFFGFNIITFAVWLACMVLAIATCIVVFVDKRDVNEALQGGDSGGEEMAEAAS